MEIRHFYKSVATMLFAPVKNCQDFFCSRKPLLIFFICLLIMVTTTFYLAFYVKHTEKIINTDAELDWFSLTHHFNKLDLCLADSADNITQKKSFEEVGVAVIITVNISNLNDFVKVNALYSLEGWRTENPKISNFFTVDFILSPNFNKTENTTTVCALITGPKQYLPENSDQCLFSDEIDQMPILNLQSCRPNSDKFYQIEILFDKKFEVYLTQDDKNIIYSHLMWSSYMLLFFILIMLIYAMFCHAENALKEYRQALLIIK